MRSVLLILSVLVVTEACNRCYMSQEPDSTGKMRWVLPNRDPSRECDQIVLGGVNVRAPPRACEPRYYDKPLISSDPEKIRSFLNCPSQLLKKRVCEDEEFSIECCNGETIDVQWALYGREDAIDDFCFINSHEPCGNRTTSLTKVKESCQGEPRCAFTVNNDFFGGDPCQDVGKYLVVHYRCSPAYAN